MIASVMIPIGVLMGASVEPPGPVDPPGPAPAPAVTSGGPGRHSGRTAVRIGGRLYSGSWDEIQAILAALASSAADQAEAPVSKRRARLAARRLARGADLVLFPDQQLEAAPDSGPSIAQLSAAWAERTAQARRDFEQLLLARMFAVLEQQERENEDAAMAAAEMML